MSYFSLLMGGIVSFSVALLLLALPLVGSKLFSKIAQILRKRKTYGRNNGIFHWLLLVLVGCGTLVRPLEASWSFAYSNAINATINFRIKVNGSVLTSVGVGALSRRTTMGTEFGGTYPAASATIEMEYEQPAGVWNDCLRTDTGTNIEVVGTGAGLNGRATPNGQTTPFTVWWQAGGVAVSFCYAGTLINDTAFPQQLKVWHNQPDEVSELVGIFYVGPGQQVPFEVLNQPAKGYIAVESNSTQGTYYIGDGMWADAPPGTFTFLADPDSTGWYSCGGTAMPDTPTLTSVRGFISDNAGPLSNAVVQASANSTNPVSEQTFQAFYQFQLSQFQEAEKQQAQRDKERTDELKLANTNLTSISGQLATLTSNILGGTNYSGPTNLAQSVAGDGIVSTNPSTYLGHASSFMTDSSNQIGSGYGPFVSAVTNVNTAPGSYDENVWRISLPNPLGGEFTFDCNPMANSVIALVAAWIKGIIAWIGAVIVLAAILKMTLDTAAKAGSFQQGRAPVIGAQIAGFGFQTSLLMHIPIFLIIAGVLVGLVVIAITALSGYGLYGILLTNPFTGIIMGASVAIQQGWWLLNQFADTGLMVYQIGIVFSYRILMFMYVMGAQLAIRVMPGMIAFAFLQWNVHAAADLKIFNYTGSTVYLAGADLPTYLVLAQGNSVLLPRYMSDISVYDASEAGLGTITNQWSIEDASVEFYLGADSGVLSQTWLESSTNEDRLKDGMLLGSVLFGLAFTKWICKLVRANRAGEVLD